MRRELRTKLDALAVNLLERGLIGQMTAFNMTRCDDRTMEKGLPDFIDTFAKHIEKLQAQSTNLIHLCREAGVDEEAIRAALNCEVEPQEWCDHCGGAIKALVGNCGDIVYCECETPSN